VNRHKGEKLSMLAYYSLKLNNARQLLLIVGKRTNFRFLTLLRKFLTKLLVTVVLILLLKKLLTKGGLKLAKLMLN
jgi:hypothetical protein